MVEGYHRVEEKRWMHTRALGTWIVNQYLKRKVKPDELVPLEIDQKREPELVSLELYEKAKKAWKIN